MPRPGVDVIIVDDVPPGGPALNTGTGMMAGKAERGPVGIAEKVSSLKDYATTYGPRAGGSLLYDAVSAFFSEGGGALYVSRVAGTGALPATGDLGTSFGVDAISPGTWGNKLKVTANDAPAPAG